MKRLIYTIFFILSIVSANAQLFVLHSSTSAKPPAAPPGNPYRQFATYGSVVDNTTHTITYTQTPVSGNLLVLVVNADAAITTPSGWTKNVTRTNGKETSMYSKVAGSSEPTNVTVTIGAATTCAMVAFEFTGRSGNLDQVVAVNGSPPTNDMFIGTTPTTTQSNEIVIAAFGAGNNTGQTLGPFISWTNGFTQVAAVVTTSDDANGDLDLAVAIFDAHSTGTFSTTVSFTVEDGHVSNGIMATYK